MQFHEVYDKELLTFFKSRRFQVPKSGLVTYISSYFQALAEMSKAFEDPSELLKHEVAYCIGQMGMPEAIASLQYFESNPLRIAHIPSSQRKKYAFDAINIILDLWQEVSG